MYSEGGYSRVGAAPRIFGLLLLVIVLVVGGAVWFDYLGLIDVTHVLAPALRWVGLEPREEAVQPDDPLLLENARLGKREEALVLLQDELDRRASELDTREAELEQLEQQLLERQAEIDDLENSLTERLRQVENERAAWERISTNLQGMDPQVAVEQLLALSDDLLLNVLLTTDDLAAQAGRMSITPVWLGLFPDARAATVYEKLSLLPGTEGAN